MRRTATALAAMTLATAFLGPASAAPIAQPTPSIGIVVQPPPGVQVGLTMKENICDKDMSVMGTISGTTDLSGSISVVRVGQSTPVVTPFHITSHGGLVTAKGPKLDCGAGVGPVRVTATYAPFNRLMYDKVFSPTKVHLSKGFSGPPAGPPQEKVRLMVVSLTGSCDTPAATMDAEVEMWSASNATGEAKVSLKLGPAPAQIVTKMVSGGPQHVTAPATLSCATGIPPLHYKLLTGFGGEGSIPPTGVEYD